jgi:hypothetical protein
MLDIGAILEAAKDRLVDAGQKVVDEATEELGSLDDEFLPDEFGTEGLW